MKGKLLSFILLPRLLPAANCKAQSARRDEQKSPGIISAIGSVKKSRAVHPATVLVNGIDQV